MFDMQEEYESERAEALEQFIMNKISKIDSEYDYELNNNDNVFKTATITEVNLDEYWIKVHTHGIEFRIQAKQNNFDENIAKLVFHIKKNSRYPLEFEQLDQSVLQKINDVQDSDVKDFHQGQFMKFKRLGQYLKNKNMLEE